MKKNISSSNTYLSKPCERCGSKRRIAKKWKENMPTFTGTTLVEYTQIVCSNKICQAELEKQLLEETKKREAVRVKKEESKSARKESSIKQANNARKNKSRI